MSSMIYKKLATADIAVVLDTIGENLQRAVSALFASGYQPDLDQNCELNAERLNYFQGLVGIYDGSVNLDG